MSATILAFFNVKGGTGKTTATVNFAYILANDYNKKVLVIDGDQQANTSKAFNVFNEQGSSLSDLLVNPKADIKEIIQATQYPTIDVISSNMSLISANRAVLVDPLVPQQTRLKAHIEKIKDEYDYIICDCPPNVDMSVINVLAVADDVIIPVKADRYSFEGCNYVLETVFNLRGINPKLKILGTFINMFVSSAVNKGGLEEAKQQAELRCFDTVVRNTVKAIESTYDVPLAEYAPKSTAASDFKALVAEYLERKEGEN